MICKCTPVNQARIRWTEIFASFIADSPCVGKIVGGTAVLISQEGNVASLVEDADECAARFTIKCLDDGGEVQDDGKSYGQLEVSLVFHDRKE